MKVEDILEIEAETPNTFIENTSDTEETVKDAIFETVSYNSEDDTIRSPEPVRQIRFIQGDQQM
jgi:hypothetical protein